MHRWLAALVCSFAFLLPQGALALGLGEMTTRSALNEPMAAEIQLLGATRDELRSLEVRLAPPEAFQRNGIDRPGYLSRLKFRVRPDRSIVEVTSVQPITEPFVTLLVEVVWPRGRLFREYTVLLDPPTYAAPEAASAPAPVTRSSTPAPRSSGVVQRQSQPAARATNPRPQFTGSTYEVQRNDTLWEIANRIRPNGTDVNQMMVALYEANPGAFAGNINRLNAGATLRVPSEDELFAINRGTALAEVRRQNQNWRGGGSLTLVAPDEDVDVGTVAGGGASTTSSSQASGQDVAALQSELADAERQLAIRNAELARLREQLAAQRETGASATDDSDDEPLTAGAAPDTTDPVTAEQADDPLYGTPDGTSETADSEVFAESDPAGLPESEPVAADASQTEAEAEQQERPAVARPVVTAPPKSESFLDQILGSIWTYVGGGILFAAVALGFLASRRRGENDTTGTWEALDAADLEDLDGTLAATGRLRELEKDRSSDTIRKPIDPGLSDDKMERTSPVEEVPPPPAQATSAEEFNIEDTFSSDTAINLDQSDPLAEADFHMAYGLFDQAADLINGALAVDSSDNRLKQKLCEIYFQWGKQDGFVDAAQKLKDSLPANDPAWNSVLIMGQQIAPAHQLFSGAVVAGGGDDLDLSFDETRSLDAGDIDAALTPKGDATGAFEEIFDGGADGGTVEQLADISGIDFEFDESLAGDAADDTAEAPIDFGELEAAGRTGDTVEQPVELDDLVDDVENTAEREGLDLSSIEIDDDDVADLTETSGDVTADIGADLLDATGVTSVLPDDFKVDIPGGEELADTAETLLADTSGTNLEDLDLDTGDETNIMPMADPSGEVDLDVADLTSELRVDDLNTTQEAPVDSGDATMFSDEVFAGDADSEADTGLNLALEDTGETNIAEVGTKLDLARAYVDMGDPEGARSILKEVLNEGDDTQQAEAKQLLETLGE
ncbi:MAG: FimV/HubP family polar landmark protein [Pseudomonadota bacterium]